MLPFFDSELTGNRVYLRGVEEADLVLRPKWFNDPEVNRTLLMDFIVWDKLKILDMVLVLKICPNYLSGFNADGQSKVIFPAQDSVFPWSKSYSCCIKAIYMLTVNYQ